MSYASVFHNAMNKPMFPGASGYGGAVKTGDVVRARQAAMGQTARNAEQARRLAEPAGTGYGSLVTKGQARAQGRRSVTIPNSPRAVGVRNPRTMRAPGPRKAVSSVPRNGNSVDLTKYALKESDFAKTGARMSRKSMMGIGLGLGVAAAVAMNRRGEGASSGRQSAYRY